MKKAIITGITRQDGAYLAKLLLDRGYEVYGTFRRTSSVNLWRIEELGVKGHENLYLTEYDLTDASASVRLISDVRPDEVYNLAAQSFVAVSFEQPITTAHITGVGALHLLEAIRIIDPNIRFYQASTSEMFGKAEEMPQTERTRFHPRSPYGVSKLFAHWTTLNYKEAYGIFACSGILFNHESPLRGLEFVTRKITDAVAKIKLGKLDTIKLGNLNAKRDWGFAKEYVEGMHMMLQHDVPDTYLLATNTTNTVRHFVELAFDSVGIDIEWRGENENETGIDAESGKTLVRVNPKFYRPCEVDILMGNPAKAKETLGWEAKTTLNDLTKMMVESDLRRNNGNGVSF